MNHARPTRSFRAFTLIELLVVITIIAILAAILFPVLAQAKTQAKKASCVSKVKQISLSSLLYSNDSDDFAVPYFYGGNGADDPYTSFAYSVPWNGSDWVTDYQGGLLSPYMRSVPLLGCPSANDYAILDEYYGALVSYGYNERFQTWTAVDADNGVYTWSTASLSAVERPSETITFGDSGYYDPFLNLVITSSNTFYGIYDAHGRHHGRATVGWVDGHVTVNRPVFADKPIGGGFLTPQDMIRNNVGIISKYPLDYQDDIFPGYPGPRSLFYYVLQKPEGL